MKSETLARNVSPTKTHTHTKGKKKCEIGIVHIVRPLRRKRKIMEKRQNDGKDRGSDPGVLFEESASPQFDGGLSPVREVRRPSAVFKPLLLLS